MLRKLQALETLDMNDSFMSIVGPVAFAKLRTLNLCSVSKILTPLVVPPAACLLWHTLQQQLPILHHRSLHVSPVDRGLNATTVSWSDLIIVVPCP